jgi:hypothetical protein
MSEEEEGLDRLFEPLRAEYGLMNIISSGSNQINDEAQIDVISKVVDNALSVNPGGRGREIALASLQRELSEALYIETTGHYRYWDANYPLSNREMRGLKRYIEKLKKDIAKLLPPQNIQLETTKRT